MKLLTAATAALLGLMPALASAATAAFTSSGVDPDDGYVTSVGLGGLAFSKDGALTRADLTDFSFDFTITSADPSLRYTDTFHYGLTDLTSFSATVQNGTLASLAFRTSYASPPDGFLAPEYVTVTSLKPGGFVSYFGPGDDAQHGTVRLVAPVPEPSAWALLIVGLTIAGYAVRRRRVTSVPALAC